MSKKLWKLAKPTIKKKYKCITVSITDFTETNNYFRKLWKKQQN